MSEQYFRRLSQSLSNAGIYTPTMLIDKERLDNNLEQLKCSIPEQVAFRIVAKSLPSIPFLQYVMEKTGSKRLMSFHIPFLMQLIKAFPDSDILLGKPMPIAAVKRFYHWASQHAGRFDTGLQLQWLVDTPERLTQYQALSDELNIPMRINLEIDVGLHRGGFLADEKFSQCIHQIKQSKQLTLAGIMGYEAHISKLPLLLGGGFFALKASKSSYQHFVKLLQDSLGHEATQALCLNTGGSSTYSLYGKTGVGYANEIATASALVKPTDFDVGSLALHLPAAFIATPVLKRVTPLIPGSPFLSRLFKTLGILPKQGCYLYGGNWLATPCYPVKMKKSTVFGHSSNQEFYQLPDDCNINVDDFVFFRPAQSEATLLQFGKLAIYEQGRITDWWSVLDYPSEFYNEIL